MGQGSSSSSSSASALSANEIAEGSRFIISEDTAKMLGPPTRLAPWLVLGSSFDARDEACLSSHNIVVVLNVAKECAPPTKLQSKTLRKKVRHERIILDDFEPDWAVFEQVLTTIDDVRQEWVKWSRTKSNDGQHGPSILVHCMRGRSRSAAAVIAWFMTRSVPSSALSADALGHQLFPNNSSVEGSSEPKEENKRSDVELRMTLMQAYAYVKLERSVIGPHHFMRAQLQRIAKEDPGNWSIDKHTVTDEDWRDFESNIHQHFHDQGISF